MSKHSLNKTPSSNSTGGGILNSLKAIISHLNPKLLTSITLCLAIITIGYSFISNIKSNQQASAEQIASSPESGVKSRINELYDILVARNLGSDTDLSSLDVINDDWGSKWNRIKTAALNNTGGGGNQLSGLPYALSSDPKVNFRDQLTGKDWSYPLTLESGAAVAKAADTGTIATWSWDASGSNNQAVGNKTAAQLCTSLGAGWRLPTKDELAYVADTMATRIFARSTNQYRWSSTDNPNNPSYALVVRWSDGNVEGHYKTNQRLVSCVR